MDLGQITNKVSKQYNRAKTAAAGLLTIGALALPAQGQDITENHIHGDVSGTTQTPVFTEDPQYTSRAGGDGEIGTVQDEYFPENSFVADGDVEELDVYRNQRDLDRPGMGSTPVIGTPLPVELTQAQLYTQGENKATLEWQTASETNNAGFTVYERTRNGDFQELGTVPGAGTTSEPQTYTKTDSDLSNNPQELEYKIEQVDLDGTKEVVARLKAENPYVGEQGVTSYPNPTRGQVNLDINLGDSEQADIEVYDVLGRRVKQATYDLQGGRLETQKDLSNLSSGTYFLRATGDNNEQYNTKITVTK